MARRHAVASPPPDGRDGTLEYVQSMLGQLRGLAQAENCDMLTYLIDMAYVEAGDMINKSPPSSVRRNKRDGAA